MATPQYIVNDVGSKALPGAVRTFDVSQLSDSRSQKLDALLHQNHNQLAPLRDPQLLLHTHMCHILGSSYYLGATSEKLQEIYDDEASSLKAIESFSIQDGLTPETWRSRLTQKEYSVAFQKLFDSEVIKHKGDWKKVLSEYLFTSEEPLVNGLCGGLGHPFIQLAYAYEYESKEIATEALSLACTEYDYVHRFLDHYPPDTSTYKTADFMDVVSKVHTDKRFEGHFDEPGFNNIYTIRETCEAAVLEHWNAWSLEDVAKQFEDAYHDAIALAIGTADASTGYDFFLAHVLTVAHALRVLLPLFPTDRHAVVFRQYRLWTLLIYIAQLRRPVDTQKINSCDTDGKDWQWVQEKAVMGKWSLDSHYVKVIRALKVAAETWPDKNTFCLKAAVKYISEFDGWTGFGPGIE